MNRFSEVAFAVAMAALSGAFEPDQASSEAKPQKAIAVLQSASGSKVSGVVTFAQKDGYVEVSGHIQGLAPGRHGFHIHEYGDVSALDGGSAGGHFNPTDRPHGGPNDAKRHVGDLGNITADDRGRATILARDKMIQLHGPNSIVGRALVVHAKADDLKSQPSGAAGARVAFGVIGIAKPDSPPHQ